MYKGEGNLERKIREGYMKDLKVQRLLGELRMGKKLKKIKLDKGLLKYKQSWMYVPHGVLKEEHNYSPIAGHRGQKSTLQWCKGGTIGWG